MANENATAPIADDKRILNGLEECAKIICISNDNPYKRGKRSENGKTFSMYRLGNIVFTVDTDNPFVKDHKEGNVMKVEFNKTIVDKIVVDDNGKESVTKVDGLELDYHLTKTQMNSFTDQAIIDEEMGLKLANLKFKKAAFETLVTKPVTDEFLAQLLNG